MKCLSKITVLTVMIVFVSFCSLTICFGALGTSNSLHGVSIECEEIWNVYLDNISTMAVGDESVVVVKNPVINVNSINYSLLFTNVDSYSQFQFEIRNDGNVDAKVKKIEITGLNEYENYIDISILNLNVGDVIEAGGLASNIKVITKYDNQYVNNGLELQPVNLENVSVNIEFEK